MKRSCVVDIEAHNNRRDVKDTGRITSRFKQPKIQITAVHLHLVNSVNRYETVENFVIHSCGDYIKATFILQKPTK